MVKMTVEDVLSCPIHTRDRNSYAEWEVLVNVMLKAHGLWKA
jgi:hypothetical protein